ncbi:hypothetical protein MSAN_01461200 [Mycena sanguinolenta]|uniref:Uncharacterized protein n=1 Tax=Mycena sanguinolenta TaxID=230812 RepID=A0A8H6YBR7_9AGAR|nr:hypothetical protein MSAN_01461200 [Mycena sanguinolenta]
MQNIHSHAILRASRLNMDEEFVEDSEPEREAQRQAQKQERKRKKLELAAMNELAATAARMNPANVIIISDESVPASPVAASKASFQLPQSSVIDISDTSTSISANENVISISSSTSDTNLNVTTAEENTNSLGAEPLASPSKSNNSDEEEIVSTLGPGLARFAYANPNPRPLGPRNSASTLQSTSSSDSQTKPAAKPKARTSSKGVAGEFSDSELAKLVKCVSCDLSWTTRKTGAQKILHIRSCAKKTGLTDDTVRLLIRKELDNPANDPGPSNRNGKATLVPAPRTTLLEDTVRDAGPRRKGKRKEVVNNLKSVSETHDNIRDKARMVFGPAPSSDDDSFPVQTQAVTANKPSAAQENCATQAFGTSRLGQQHRYKSLLGGQDSDDEPDALPATQAFAPSKLGGRTPATSGWGYESESESSVQEPDAPAAETPLNFPSSSAKELSPTFSPRTKKKTIVAAPTFLAMESESDHDAYVHFDPELELNGEAVESTLSGKSKKNKETTRETPTKSETKVAQGQA